MDEKLPHLNERYSVQKKIATGPFKDIYLAYDQNAKCNVVIKTFDSPEIWDEVYSNRDRLMRLAGDTIPRIYAVDSINGNHCMIEEYIEGSPLSEWIESGKLTFRMFFDIVDDLLCALETLHSNGFSHGDVKPQNILVKDSDGKTSGYLIDIDSALMHQKNRYAFFGTLSFAAPEQLLENSVDRYSDIYSLGMVMYCMLERGLPFQLSKDGLLRRVRGTERITLSVLEDGAIKNELESLINAMTDKNPALRPSVESVRKRKNTLLRKMQMKRQLERQIKAVSSVSGETEYGKTRGLFMSRTFMKTFYSRSIMQMTSSVQRERLPEELYIAKTQDSESQSDSYQQILLEEYSQLSRQAEISFWLWVMTFVLGLGLVILAVVMIWQQRYTEAVCSVLLESLVYFAQGLFEVREDSFREQNKDKLRYLKAGANYELIMRIIESADKKYSEKRIDRLLDYIGRDTDQEKENS